MSEKNTAIVEEDYHGTRLDNWLAKRFEYLNFNNINILCRKGSVRVNGSRVKASYRLINGDVVKIPPLLIRQSKDYPASAQLSEFTSKLLLSSIVFKDKYLLAINKPEGIATQGGTKQGNNHIDGYRSVLKLDHSEDPKLVHRLDKDTSGVMLLARDSKTAREITSMFRKREIEKTYWALVKGGPKKDFGSIKSIIEEKEIWRPKNKNIKEIKSSKYTPKPNSKKFAVTHYRVMERMGSNYSWVLLKPATGRTHQLRIHTFNLGAPIIGDRKYSVEDQETSTDLPEVFGKLFLHARAVFFNHPETGMPMVINAKLPEHMLKVWRFFGWDFESQDYSLSPFEK